MLWFSHDVISAGWYQVHPVHNTYPTKTKTFFSTLKPRLVEHTHGQIFFFGMYQLETRFARTISTPGTWTYKKCLFWPKKTHHSSALQQQQKARIIESSTEWIMMTFNKNDVSSSSIVPNHWKHWMTAFQQEARERSEPSFPWFSKEKKASS